MSFFDNIDEAQPIEVFYKNKLFLDDPSPVKVNLTIGAYRTNEGKPWILPVVRQAEQQIVVDDSLNHEYLPVLGYQLFTRAATELVLGSDSVALKEGRAIGVQCLSGTGALRAGAEFLSRILGSKIVYVSKPTWGNHKLVFKNAGFESILDYQYWDPVNFQVDINNLLKNLETAPEKAVVILHGCAHNPTGMDPSKEQWQEICKLIKRKNLFTFFDIAYQGFASGNPDADAWPIRYFVEQGLELVVSQSFAKNFGLYNERVGNLTIVVNDPKTILSIQSQMSLIIRANWSNPPAFGARIVYRVLTQPELRQQWFDAIQAMSSRIRDMRSALRGYLEKIGTPGSWKHITEQIGMFSYTGLTTQQVNYLIQKHKVYLLSDGRINICGLNTSNVEYVAKSIDDTVRSIKSHI